MAGIWRNKESDWHMFWGVAKEEDAYLSRKLKVLSFVAAISVVCIHSATLSNDTPYPVWAKFIQNLFSVYMPCWAVPFFFMVSGFLFANSRYFREEEGYFDFVRRKWHSLGVPFVIFLLFGSLVSSSVCMITNIVAHRSLVFGTFWDSATLFELVDKFIGITGSDPLHNGPMWYIRALLILFALAPIWRFLFNKVFNGARVAALTFICVTLAIVVFYREFNELLPFMARKALCLHFFIGILVAQHPSFLLSVKSKCQFWAGLLAVISISLSALAAIPGFFSWEACQTLLQFMPLVWVPFIWVAYDAWLPHGLREKPLPKLFDWSFWLYCVHGSVFTVVVALGHFILGESTLAVLVWMPCCFALDFLGPMLLALLLSKSSPRVFYVLCGGRI